MVKAAKVIDLPIPEAPPQLISPASRAKTYPQGPPKLQPVPFPEALDRVLESEWENLSQTKNHKLIDRLYSLPEQVMKRLKTPSVDAPVAACPRRPFSPLRATLVPRTPAIRVEAALKKNFDSASQAFRVSVASSIFSRATYAWAEELTNSEPSLSKCAKCTLKKMALASAAAADCAYDNMQLVARNMGTGVMARRHIWLRHWQGDAASSSRILNLPFKGERLFGDELEPLLIKDSEKHKVLPSKKEPAKKVLSFRSFSSSFKPKGNYQPSKLRWDKNRTPFKFRKQGGPSSSGTQTGKSSKPQQSS